MAAYKIMEGVGILAQSSRYDKTIMFFIKHSVVLLMGLCFAIVWIAYYREFSLIPFYKRSNFAFIFLYMFLYHIFTNLYGGYRIGTARLTDIVYSNWLSAFIVNVITYIQIVILTKYIITGIPFFIVMAVEMSVICIWAWGTNRLYFKMFKPLRLLCLYSGEYPKIIISRFENRPEKFEIVRSVKLEGEGFSISDVMKGEDGLVIYNIPDEKYAAVLSYCVERGIRYYLVPTLGDIMLRTSDIIYIFDIPLFLAKNEPLSPEERFVKRTFDIVLSLVALVVAAIPMAIIAVCIKMYDGGPVFYTQKRCTIGGRRFNILKFRSMKVNAERGRGAVLAEEDDPRITPIGRVIRKLRLDEFPQFLNILAGDMSFVGPRPERPALIAKYKKTVPEFDSRLRLKCGLTGFAQVMGRYNTSPQEKLKLDIIYIQTYSILLDIKIILMTIKVIFMKESTQGVEPKAK